MSFQTEKNKIEKMTNGEKENARTHDRQQTKNGIAVNDRRNHNAMYNSVSEGFSFTANWKISVLLEGSFDSATNKWSDE